MTCLRKVAFLFPGGHLAAEADLLLAEALLDDLIQAVEGAADDEEDVPGIEGALLLLAGAAVVLDGLDLGDRVVGHLQVHFGLFHGFEQGPLHPGAGDVRPAPGVRRGGDLVDFVDIDDAVLGQFQVIAGGVNQVPHQVFHVAAHVAGFAELGGVPLDERAPRSSWQ